MMGKINAKIDRDRNRLRNQQLLILLPLPMNGEIVVGWVQRFISIIIIMDNLSVVGN